MSLLSSFGLMMLKFFSFVASLGFSNKQLTKSTLVYRDYTLGVLLGSNTTSILRPECHLRLRFFSLRSFSSSAWSPSIMTLLSHLAAAWWKPWYWKHRIRSEKLVCGVCYPIFPVLSLLTSTLPGLGLGYGGAISGILPKGWELNAGSKHLTNLGLVICS